MGIIQRFSDIMRSNINALLDKAEDPAKMVDQMLLDMRRDLADVKSETAGIMADEKTAKRKLDACTAEIDQLTSAAKKAIAAGNDDDARVLLSRKQEKEGVLASLAQAYDVAHANAVKMRQMTEKLTADIQTLEAKKDGIKATAAAAKAQEKINKATTGGRDMGASMAAMSRLEEKAQARLDKATAEAELEAGSSETTDILKKYQGGGSASVDDELARLKAEMGAGE